MIEEISLSIDSMRRPPCNEFASLGKWRFDLAKAREAYQVEPLD